MLDKSHNKLYAVYNRRFHQMRFVSKYLMINSQHWGNAGLRFLIENEIIFFFIQFPLVAFNQSFEMMPFIHGSRSWFILHVQRIWEIFHRTNARIKRELSKWHTVEIFPFSRMLRMRLSIKFILPASLNSHCLSLMRFCILFSGPTEHG